MLVIAVTGQIASGKSTTSRLLAARGGKLIDADEGVHNLLGIDGNCYLDVRSKFGESILNPDGSINREKLAQIVFSDEKKLKDLEKIVHPFVVKEIRESINRYKEENCNMLVVDIPLLDKGEIDDVVDLIIVVDTNIDNQLDRLNSDGVTKEDALKRIKFQPSKEELRKKANITIENNGSLDDLRLKIDEIYEREIKQLARNHS